MQESSRAKHVLCNVILLAVTLTLTWGQITDCPYTPVKLFNDLYMSEGHMMTCGAGTVYSPLQCACVHGISNRPKCQYLANDTDSTKYVDILTGGSLSCPPAHVYNEHICKCELPLVPQKVCEPRFSLDFNLTANNKISRYNVGGVDSVNVVNGVGHFNPASSIVFWTFIDRPLEKDLQIQMSFKDNPLSNAPAEVLLSNCQAKDMYKRPSLQIVLDKSKSNANGTNYVRVLMRTYENPPGVEVKVPFKSGQTNILVVLKAMNTLKVKIFYPNGQSVLGFRSLPGDIVTSTDYLHLGACGGMNNGFNGLVDWFDYFPCWPRARGGV